MALPDLTGQNIQDTYQRVLQTDGSLLYNGTGSLITILPTTASHAVSASYAVSASHEIIKEVSSSFADTASYVTPLNQDVQITGSLTANGLVHTLASTTGTNGFKFQSNQIKPIINGFISLDRTSNRSFVFSDLGGSRQYLRIDSLSSVDEANITFNEGQMYISSSGNVGIGTTSPSAKLHVFSDTHSDFLDNGILLDVSSSDEGEPAVAFRNQSDMGSNYWIAGVNEGGSNFDFAYGTAFTSANTKVRITSDGNVGIGTTNPAVKLTVNGGNIRRTHDANNYSQMGAGGSGGFINGYSGNSEKFMIRAYASSGVQAFFTAGNVGIGTTSPTSKLQVKGSGTTDATTAFRVENSNGDDTFIVRDDGKVGIGTTSPDASAILDIASTSKGVVFPRMTSAQRTSISSPTTGLIVYQTDATEGLYIYKSTGWVQII